MKKNNFLMTIIERRIILVMLMLLMSSNYLFADGSRDLYPSGKIGYRAYLRSSTVADTERWPFPTQGTHFVYAKVGEKITLASSAQGGGAAAIVMTNPAGTIVINNTTGGRILNRAAELAGPQISGTPTGGRYAPVYYTVPSGGAGIYKVDLVARAGGDPSPVVKANAEWEQVNNAGIMAWDISVVNAAGTAFISGRVYSTVLCLSNGINTPDTVDFHGLIYALTDDGFTYRINNNGNNGLYFTFFVNNNGFIGEGSFPVYKSLNKTNLVATDVQNPTSADTPTQKTHKLFYALPASDLPVLASGAVPGGTTWLKTVPVTPIVSNLSVLGVEGTTGQISTKGGYITFNSNRDGKYNIKIQSGSVPPAFVPRILTGFVAAGANTVFWDDKDGAGNSLPAGTNPADVSVKIQGAEVHFPYIDMEYNKQGTIIELLKNSDLSVVESDIVYWNDIDIPDATGNTSGNNAPFGRYSSPKNNSHLQAAPANINGVKSNENGHKWGQGATGTAGQFGDKKSMDTWAFVTGPTTTTEINIVSKIADLKISGLTADKQYVIPGEQLNLTVKVKNDGPSDAAGAKFTFVLPQGYNPQNVTFAGNGCGTMPIPVSYDTTTRIFTSTLNVPSGCEISFIFSIMPQTTVVAGSQAFIATILRPNDVTDPDATNPDPTVPPTDAQFECSNNGSGGNCNNILKLNLTTQIPFAGCDSTMYLSQYPVSGGTSFYTLNNVTNPLTITQIGNTSVATVRLNGIGFNPKDNYIYGINSVDNHLFRVAADASVDDLGAVTNLGPGEFISGDIDHLGNFYVKANNGSLGGTSLYRIDVNTRVATEIVLSQQVRLADFAYNKVDGFLYGVGVATERLVKINPLTGAVSTSTQTTGVGGAFGAMYTDGITGAVYGNSNTDNNFYRFNTTTGKATLISNSISSQGNDGAHCVNMPIQFGANLSITKTDGKFTYIPGTTNVYTVVATNLGPFTATDAIVSDLLPVGIPAENVTYTATASTGSVTSIVGTQNGAVNDLIDIQPAGKITYTITLLVPSNYTGDLTNIATVTVSANNIDPDLSDNSARDTDTFGACYDDPALGIGSDSKHGITLLQRAGADNGNWPMVRKGAFTVLESNTKGFVITRMTSDPGQTAATNYIGNITAPQDGMMIYDTFSKCLKIYTVEVLPVNSGWKCFSTPACP